MNESIEPNKEIPTPRTLAIDQKLSAEYPRITFATLQATVAEISKLERELVEKEKAYQTVKDWAHRLEDKLTTLIDKFDEHADGTVDATPLEKFCNEMIGLSNEISLGEVWGIKKQLKELLSERDQLKGENERLKSAIREHLQEHKKPTRLSEALHHADFGKGATEP